MAVAEGAAQGVEEIGGGGLGHRMNFALHGPLSKPGRMAARGGWLTTRLAPGSIPAAGDAKT